MVVVPSTCLDFALHESLRTSVVIVLIVVVVVIVLIVFTDKRLKRGRDFGDYSDY
jgi:preprotein translocase subunit SecF